MAESLSFNNVTRQIACEDILNNQRRESFKFYNIYVDPGGPMVIILATGSEVRGFKPGWGRWIFSERKNSNYDFLRKGSKVVGPVL